MSLRLKNQDGPTYQHEIVVVISTYHPRNNSKELADEIKQMLGPWCEYARCDRMNVRLPESTSKHPGPMPPELGESL